MTPSPVSIASKPDEYAVSMLVAFNTPVTLGTCSVVPDTHGGFTVNYASEGRKPVRYATAAPAVRCLRRISGL